MSAGFVGTIGSVATGQLQQTRGADVDRAAQDATKQARATEAAERAENAAGIGEMEQEQGTSERDADGRRLWEKRSKPAPLTPPNDPAEASAAARSRDPSGDSGTQLDLTG